MSSRQTPISATSSQHSFIYTDLGSSGGSAWHEPLPMLAKQPPTISSRASPTAVDGGARCVLRVKRRIDGVPFTVKLWRWPNSLIIEACDVSTGDAYHIGLDVPSLAAQAIGARKLYRSVIDLLSFFDTHGENGKSARLPMLTLGPAKSLLAWRWASIWWREYPLYHVSCLRLRASLYGEQARVFVSLSVTAWVQGELMLVQLDDAANGVSACIAAPTMLPFLVLAHRGDRRNGPPPAEAKANRAPPTAERPLATGDGLSIGLSVRAMCQYLRLLLHDGDSHSVRFVVKFPPTLLALKPQARRSYCALVRFQACVRGHSVRSEVPSALRCLRAFARCLLARERCKARVAPRGLIDYDAAGAALERMFDRRQDEAAVVIQCASRCRQARARAHEVLSDVKDRQERAVAGRDTPRRWCWDSQQAGRC